MASLSLLLILSLITDAQSSGSNFLQETNVVAHNSFHIRQYSTFTTLLDQAEIPVFIPVYHYSYPSLATLLDNNVCGLELEIFPKEDWIYVTEVDFPVQHRYKYDTESNCNTLSTCLSEISAWMTDNTDQQSCPINIELHLQSSNSGPKFPFPNDDLLKINEIVQNAFTEAQLYTPTTHGAHSTDIHWPGFDTATITNNHAWVSINKNVIELLYPNAITVATDDSDQNTYENQYSLFVRCTDPSYARYCVIINGEIQNEADRGKYIFTKSVADKFLQLSEYPCIQSPQGYSVQMPETVTNDANYWVEQMSLQRLDLQTGLVGYKLWNAWMIAAYMDSMGNNDGMLNVEEVTAFVNEDQTSVSKIQIALQIKDLWQLGINATMDGMSVNNALVWMGLSLVLEAEMSELVPMCDVNAAILETCQAIKEGYTFVKMEYPYPMSGSEWQFTFDNIECDSVYRIGGEESESVELLEHEFIDWVENNEQNNANVTGNTPFDLMIDINWKTMLNFWSFMAVGFIVIFTLCCYYHHYKNNYGKRVNRVTSLSNVNTENALNW